MAEHVREAAKYWKSINEGPFVYFVREGAEGPIKIGFAHDPIERVAALQCGNHRELRIVGLILAADAHEGQLHRHWAAARVRGEWFGNGYEQQILDTAERITTAQFKAR